MQSTEPDVPARAPGAPLVSVVMPMFNTAELVGASIRSVLAQTEGDWELLIVDDHSTDDSYEAAHAFSTQDERVRVLRNDGAKGAAHARNHAIAHARGRFIAFLDSDDMWLPTKLSKQLALAQSSRAPLTYTAYYKIDADSHLEAHDFEPNGRVVRAPTVLEYRHLLRQDYVGFLTAMFDTAQLGELRFPDIDRRQDYALVLQVLRGGARAQGLAEPLALYRARRPGALSTNKLTAARYNWRIYRHVEQLPLPRAIVAFGNYALRTTRKYFI